MSLITRSAPVDPPHHLVRSIVRKTDFTLLPFLSLLFLLNSLDRSNIGNAETAGYTRDTGLSPEDLNYAVGVFFLLFVALQPVGAAFGKKFGPHRFIPVVMAGWGLLTVSSAWVKGKYGVMLLRGSLGMLEAGFYPTAVHYLSTFYTKYEFASRLGFFAGMYVVSAAFAGLFATFVFWLFPIQEEATVPENSAIIMSTESTLLKPWQILFLLQGGLTFIVSSAAWWYMPPGPGAAWWLEKGEERMVAEVRITMDRSTEDDLDVHGQADPNHGIKALDVVDHSPPGERSPLLPGSGYSKTSLNPPLTKQDIFEAFTDHKVYWILIVNILSSIAPTAFNIFLPVVLKSLGYKGILANVLTVPPFCLGAAVLYCTAKLSDKRKERLRYAIIGLGISTIGLLGLVFGGDRQAGLEKYILLCILLSGTYVASPLTITWITNNMEEPGKRAIVLGINGWGNFAGILSSAIYSPAFGPSYRLSFLITLICMVVSIAGYYGLLRHLEQENNRRKMILSQWTKEERELEKRLGLGPTGSYGGEREEGWLKRNMRRIILGEGGWDLEMVTGGRTGRRGDEKVTFVYGL